MTLFTRIHYYVATLLLLLLMPSNLAPGVTALSPPKYEPFPVGSITPKGWLHKQLTLQAEGLSGILADYWPSIRDSYWVGGSFNDQGLHEKAPYWLNGVVPLSFLLNNADKSKQKSEKEQIFNFQRLRSPYTSGNQPDKDTDDSSNSANVRVTKQVERYIKFILSNQTKDGWLGPLPANQADGVFYWGPTMALLALEQYAEGKGMEGDGAAAFEAGRAVLKHMQLQFQWMHDTKLHSWSAARWQDMGLAVEWLIDHSKQLKLSETEVNALDNAAKELMEQGLDWATFLSQFNTTAISHSWHGQADWSFVHNVNVAQAMKVFAVMYRITGDIRLKDMALQAMAKLDELYGLPTGMFNGDEWLPWPATRHPSHGIELCGVVEAMFSYVVLFQTFGDTAFIDRATQIAFNAMPATWASPGGGEMLAHQYLQGINQVYAVHQPKHIWQHDGPDAMLYGLEPNYGCCTANFNQGWPKFSSMTVLKEGDDTVVIATYLPLTVTLTEGVTVEIETTFPFEDEAVVAVKNPTKKAYRVAFVVPKWSDGMVINGARYSDKRVVKEVPIGACVKFSVALNPKVEVKHWHDNSVSIHRGTLLYSLPIQPKFNTLKHNFVASYDYSVTPANQDEWNYALNLSTITFSRGGRYTDTEAPFSRNTPGGVIHVKGRAVYTWKLEGYTVEAPPPSPVKCDQATCGPEVLLELIPHGKTALRIGEFPYYGSDFASKNPQEPAVQLK